MDFLGLKYFRKFLVPLVLGASGACSEGTLFEKLESEHTGIEFSNNVQPSLELNIFNYLYFYNGGGVGAGDLNGDGLQDLVFISNQEQNHIYLNQGGFRFLDISDRLKQEDRTGKWSTGVSLADVNADGRLDIYICEVGNYLRLNGSNKLYINLGNDENGRPNFEEQSAKFGLNFVGFSTQAAFFDYDLDNDLDMYLMNHSVHSNGTFGRSEIRTASHPLAGDRFFRNDNGQFVDITSKVGIYNSQLGYGLGIGISDINHDGYPDIYVGNDFHEDDYLYINKGDGTFKECLADMVRHTSRFSMGNDLVDINNDGLVDILSLDMLPREYQKLKTSAGEDAYDVYQYKLKKGYKDQFARNTLQINRGNNHFSEVGLLAGIAATDWSWSGLCADFDLDGWNDLYVANGIMGRTNDMDYIKFISNEAIQMRLDENSMTEQDLILSEKMPVEKIPNYAFKNIDGIRFKDVSEYWGLDDKSFSNGATYVDLDNDGDLDLVTNNINGPAFVYQNNAIETQPNLQFLKIRFEGPPGNPYGIGARFETNYEDNYVVKELFPVRGYESTVPTELHIGIDSTLSSLQKIKITWPDGRVNVLREVQLNQTLLVDYKQSRSKNHEDYLVKEKELFENITAKTGISYKHKENDFLEFNREALLPGMVSALGPAFAKEDVNGDGLDDFFVGGAKHQGSYIYVQKPDGTFTSDSVPDDPKFEDVDAVFLDYDGDGDSDLMVASGGNEFWGKNEALNPRLYKNEGGKFIRAMDQLRGIYINASKMAAADYDQDGDIDVFIGERAVPRRFGAAPHSLLLRNENGMFLTDSSQIRGDKLGMVTDAKWADMDADGKLDLIVASDWAGISVLYQEENGFHSTELPHSSGLWNCLEVVDIDGNGHLDIIGGNLGINSKLATSGERLLKMYVNDFDDNESTEQIVTITEYGKEYFFADKDELTKQMTFIKKKYIDYRSFAEASIEDIFPSDKISGSVKYQVSDTRSAIFYQRTENTFDRKPLSIEGQIAPVFEILVNDFNFDRKADIMLGGNFSRSSIQRGKYDASMGEIFLQRSDHSLKYISQNKHGLYLSGEVRHLAILSTSGDPILVVVKNNGPIEIYSFKDFNIF